MSDQYQYECDSCGYELMTDDHGFEGLWAGMNQLYYCDKCNSFLNRFTSIDSMLHRGDFQGSPDEWRDMFTNQTVFGGIWAIMDSLSIDVNKTTKLNVIEKLQENECPVCRTTGFIHEWNPCDCKCPKCHKGKMTRSPGGPIIHTD